MEAGKDSIIPEKHERSMSEAAVTLLVCLAQTS